ncbi:MAG: hypothetical protein MRY59_07535 [Aquisalinus sp.]|nr:hypothetical protein [Aquisalinus sp.]
MRRAHRTFHLLAWLVIIPVTLTVFFWSLSSRQPDPQNSDAALDQLQQGQP